jgi:hypothetical protein
LQNSSCIEVARGTRWIRRLLGEAVRQIDDRGTVLAHFAEQPDQPLEQRVGLVGADAPFQPVEPALEQRRSLLAQGRPDPLGGVDLALDLGQPLADHQVVPRSIGGDQPEQVARRDLALEEIEQRLAHRRPLVAEERLALDDEHDHAVARIAGQLQPFTR